MSAETYSCTCTEVARPDPPSLYCDIPIGKDTSGNFTLSYKGVAIRTDCNRYIAFRRESGAPASHRDKVRAYKAAEEAKTAAETKRVHAKKAADEAVRAEAEAVSEEKKAAAMGKTAAEGEASEAAKSARARAVALRLEAEAAIEALEETEGRSADVEKDYIRLWDVTGLTLPGCDALIYRVPVTAANVRPHDLLLISECPFQVLYVTSRYGDTVRGVTASGEEITYVSPTRLGDCARYIRIVSVLDTCGIQASEMKEDDIALIAALLCCKPCGNGSNYGADFLSSTVAGNLLSGFKNQLPLLLALQQSSCLESFILTRALQGRVDGSCEEPKHLA